jgi:D-alanine-D-alanine ligase
LTVITDALKEAVERPVNFPQSGFGQGIALRAAGGIAAKLVGLEGPSA